MRAKISSQPAYRGALPDLAEVQDAADRYGVDLRVFGKVVWVPHFERRPDQEPTEGPGHYEEMLILYASRLRGNTTLQSKIAFELTEGKLPDSFAAMAAMAADCVPRLVHEEEWRVRCSNPSALPPPSA